MPGPSFHDAPCSSEARDPRPIVAEVASRSTVVVCVGVAVASAASAAALSLLPADAIDRAAARLVAENIGRASVTVVREVWGVVSDDVYGDFRRGAD